MFHASGSNVVAVRGEVEQGDADNSQEGRRRGRSLLGANGSRPKTSFQDGATHDGSFLSLSSVCAPHDHDLSRQKRTQANKRVSRASGRAHRVAHRLTRAICARSLARAAAKLWLNS